MTSRLIEKIGVNTIPVHMAFGITDHGDANTTAVVAGGQGNEYRAMYGGQIIGISAVSNADFTGGTIVFNPTIGGTADTSLGCTLDDTHQSANTNIDAGGVPFAAGSLIGVKTTKSGTVAPTTADITILLLVLYENVDY